MSRTANAVKPKRDSENGESEKVKEIFNDLRKAVDGLEKIINGQRKINGSLYTVLETVLNKLPKEFPPSRTTELPGYEKITPRRARSLVEGIPHVDPPGCQEPEHPGGN
jgi:hypothetical protein